MLYFIIMIVNVYSRNSIINKIKNKWLDVNKDNIISINTNVFKDRRNESELSEMKRLLNDFENVLFLEFDDATRVEHQRVENRFPGTIKFFSEEDAKQIIDFVNKTYEIGHNLIVHCTAGVSRSAAVGIFANEFINRFKTNNEDDFNYNKFNGFERAPTPNLDVLTMLRRKSGMTCEDEIR